MASSIMDTSGTGEKRGRDGEDAVGEKRQHVGDIVMKMAVTNKDAGTIIGKGGSVLKRVVEESGAKTRISSNSECIPTGERICTIQGDAESVGRAQHLICELLADARSPEEISASQGERTLKLLVPNVGAGTIIGKGGSVIKELNAQTGAFIKVSQPGEVIPQTQERVVSIKGTQPAVDAAAAAITEKLFSMAPAQHPKEVNYAVLKQAPQPAGYPHHPGGYGAPPPGPPAPYPPPYAGGAPSYAGGGPSYAGGSSFSAAAPAVRPPAPPMAYKDFVSTLPPATAPADALTHYQDYLSKYAATPSGPAALSSPHSAPSTTHSMPLRDQLVSGIIGKGGSVIKDIGLRSGARVLVSQKTDLTAAGERTVNISGSAEAVAAAQRMISDKCREIEAEQARRASGGLPPPVGSGYAGAHAPPLGGGGPAGYQMPGYGGAQPPYGQMPPPAQQPNASYPQTYPQQPPPQQGYSAGGYSINPGAAHGGGW